MSFRHHTTLSLLMPRSSRTSQLSKLLLAITFIALGAAASPAGATTNSPNTVSLNTANESPIAVPFIGDYEVWCTDRNPAPGNRCRSHHGSPAIDLGMDPGTPLYAAGDGTVIDADNHCPARGSCNNGKGNSVIIAHADGRFSRYLHMGQVAVQTDDIVTFGQPIGTSGESGQNSSPHLHYDEHFPFGTRNDMGQWIGCVNGEQVIYPEVFGTSDWNAVPYGSRVINDGFDCLAGFTIGEATPEPRILPGTTHFGVTPPSQIARSTYQISIDRNDGSEAEVISLSGTTLVYRVAPTSTVSIQVRQLVKGAWKPWSAAVDYSPSATAEALPVCAGLYATTASMTGTPDADVIVGTDANDQIDARGGDDIICGNAGDDTVHAGIGKDNVFGGTGNDTISGGRGIDILRGESGTDTINGGSGRDKLIGGAGDDALLGNAGNDSLDGGAGDDELNGGIGHDALRGRAGNDTLDGRNGRDLLLGGNGDDDLLGGNGQDRLVGGAGLDDFDGGPGSDRCASADNETTITECER